MNITRREALKAIASTAVVAAVPAVAMADAPKSYDARTTDFYDKVAKAVRHLENLSGRYYDPDYDTLHFVLPKDMNTDAVRHSLYATYPKVCQPAFFAGLNAIRVSMWHRPESNAHVYRYRVEYDFDTETWKGLTDKLFSGR